MLAAVVGFGVASEQRLQDWQEQEGITFDPVDPAPDPTASQNAGDVPAGRPTPRVTDAEALLALAQDALAAEQTAYPSIARRCRAQLTAQVDPLSGWGRLADGELLPPTSLKQVMRTLPGRGGVLRLRPLTDADLRTHDLGRGSREVTPALRELLGALDGERCRMLGCTRRRKLHAHHVRFWSDGGSTDLANLVNSEYIPIAGARPCQRCRVRAPASAGRCRRTIICRAPVVGGGRRRHNAKKGLRSARSGCAVLSRRCCNVRTREGTGGHAGDSPVVEFVPDACQRGEDQFRLLIGGGGGRKAAASARRVDGRGAAPARSPKSGVGVTMMRPVSVSVAERRISSSVLFASPNGGDVDCVMPGVPKSNKGLGLLAGTLLCSRRVGPNRGNGKGTQDPLNTDNLYGHITKHKGRSSLAFVRYLRPAQPAPVRRSGSRSCSTSAVIRCVAAQRSVLLGA